MGGGEGICGASRGGADGGGIVMYRARVKKVNVVGSKETVKGTAVSLKMKRPVSRNMQRFCLLMLILVGLGCSKRQTAESGEDSFDVVITEIVESKIIAIKGVREVTGLGLKDAMDLVENMPAIIKSKIPKKEAETIAQRLRASSLTVQVRPH